MSVQARDWSALVHALEGEALPAARRLADAHPPDHRTEAHLVCCLLQVLAGCGLRVGVSYGALVDAIEGGYPDEVRIIVSVTSGRAGQALG